MGRRGVDRGGAVMRFFSKSSLIAMAAVIAAMPSFAQTRVPQTPRSTTFGRATRGYLGVGVVALADDRVKALGLKDDHGVEVKRVEEGTAAEKAGLKEGDVILEVNGKSFDDVEQFIRMIAEQQPRAKVGLTIWRGNAQQTLTATLDERAGRPLFLPGPNGAMPPMPPMPTLPPNVDDQFNGIRGNSARVGFEGEGLTGQLADYFGVKAGVLVRSVAANTAASRAGLKAGDVVTKVNGTPVGTPREITGLVRSSGKKSVSFTVMRNRKEMSVDVEVARQERNGDGSDRQVL
jgi:serine protease Do